MALTAAAFSVADDVAYQKRLTLPTEDAVGYARCVTVDLEANEVLVCDSRQNRILIFDDQGFFRYVVPGGSVFSSPVDLAVDPDGYLLVLANHEGRRSIIELDYDGLFLREIRLGDASGNDVGQKFASIAVSPSGERIYVTDSQDMKLWIADRDGRILAAIDLAQDLTEDDRSDTILGKVDVYADTVLMAAPGAGVVRLYDLDGGERGFIGTQGTTPCNLAFPVAAAMDDEGHIWIVDQQRMVYSRWSIEEDRCLEEYFGPGNLPGYLYYPLDLALDASGRLYVSQGFEGRVQSYTGAPAAARNEEPSPSE